MFEMDPIVVILSARGENLTTVPCLLSSRPSMKGKMEADFTALWID